MVLKFGSKNKDDQQNLLVSRTQLSDGSYLEYNVYLDDKLIGTTMGAHDGYIVIHYFKYGVITYDAARLMERMCGSLTINDLLAMGDKV